MIGAHIGSGIGLADLRRLAASGTVQMGAVAVSGAATALSRASGSTTLQTRPGDRERWQATMQVAQQYIMAGAPTEPMRPFRTEDNASIPMTAQDAADCLNAMQAFFGQALDALWNHKDAVRASATAEDAFNYDITTNWP